MGSVNVGFILDGVGRLVKDKKGRKILKFVGPSIAKETFQAKIEAFKVLVNILQYSYGSVDSFIFYRDSV